MKNLNTNILHGCMIGRPDCGELPVAQNSEAAVYASESTIMLKRRSDGAVLQTFDAGAEARCGIACGGGFIIMTDAGALHIYKESGEWRLAGESMQSPGALFVAEPAGTISRSTQSFTSSSGVSLTEGAHSGSSLRRRISSALAEAYGEVRAEAADAGLFVQPVVARCRYVDSGGATVSVSAPQLVGAEGLWQCMKLAPVDIARRSDTDFTVSPMTVSAQAWRLEVTVPARTAPGMERVARVMVEVSGEIDPVDEHAVSAVRFERVRDTSPACTVGLPGATVGMAPRVESLRREAAAIAARMGDCSRVALIAEPGDAPARWRVMPGEGARRAESVAPGQSLLACVRAPHSFAARHALRSGDCVAWAGITPRAFRGYHPAEILAPGEDSFICTVEIFGGDALIASRTERVSGRSRAFAPMVSYPHPGAGEMRVTFADSGGSIAAALSPCGDIAVAFDGAAPQESGTAGAQVFFGKSLPGAVISADIADPMAAVSCIDVCAGRISGLTPACRSHSSWDFARSHLYLFADTGIYALCFNAGRGYVSSTVIDTRSAGRGGVYTSQGVYAPVSGGVVKITGARTRQFIALPIEAEAVRAVGSEENILCTSAAGESVMIDAADGAMCRVGDAGAVEWSAEVKMPAGSYVLFAEVAMIAGHFCGTLEAVADGGRAGSASVTLGAIRVDGAVEAPLRWRILPAPRRARTVIRLSGMAEAPLTIISYAIKSWR